MSVIFNLKTSQGTKQTFKITKNTKEIIEITNSQGNLYELVNENTSLGLEKFVTKRVGNNLNLYLFKEEQSEITDQDQPSIIIKDYYVGEKLNPIVGLGEDGSYYQYIADASTESAVSSLKDNVLAVQILNNSTKFSVLDHWSISTVALAGLTAGAVAAAASGGSGGGAVAGSNSRSPNKIPEENDKNKNGIQDDVEEAKADAALTDAEKAKEKVEDAIRDAAPGYTEKEVKDINDLKKTYEDKKKAAQDAVEAINGLPDHGKYDERLEKLKEIATPKENDQNNDNFPDNTSKLDTVKKELKKAEDIKAIMEERDIGAGVSAQDVKNIKKDVENFEKAKEKAKELIDALEDGAEKDALLKEWKKLGDSRDIPEINDTNNNEVPDNFDDAIAALNKAKDAEKAMKGISVDDAVSKKEAQDIAQAVKAYNEAKKAAEDLINNLPDGDKTDALKAKLKADLSKLKAPIKVPDVTDTNENNINDNEDRRSADAALKEAEKLKEEINKAKGDSANGGKGPEFTPGEVAQIENLIDKYNEKRADAEKVVKQTEGLKEHEDFKTRLDNLGKLTPPTANSASNEEDLKAAKAAVEAAKQKQNEMNEIDVGKAVSSQDKKAVAEAAKAYEDAKKAAQKLVDALDSNAEKTQLQDNLNKLGKSREVTVNDVNNNEIADDADKQAAETALAKAEAAKSALEKAIKGKGAALTQDEVNSLNADKQKYEDAKTEATEKVNATKSQGGDGATDLPAYESSLKGRLDALKDVVLKANDKNGNDIADTTDETHAKTAIEKAKVSKQALESAVTDKEVDSYATKGVAELKKALSDYKEVLKQAETAVAATKKSSTGNSTDTEHHTDINNALNELKNANKTTNQTDDAADVEKVINALDTLHNKEVAWNDALAAAKKGEDRAISQADHNTLDAKAKEFKQALDAAKATLSEVKGLPVEEALKAAVNSFKEKVVPEVNDGNLPKGEGDAKYPENGIPDIEDKAADKVKVAKEKAADLDEKIEELMKDGTFSKEDEKKVEDLKAEADKAKDEAKDAIDALEEGNSTKTDLGKEVEKIDNSLPSGGSNSGSGSASGSDTNNGSDNGSSSGSSSGNDAGSSGSGGSSDGSGSGSEGNGGSNTPPNNEPNDEPAPNNDPAKVAKAEKALELAKTTEKTMNGIDYGRAATQDEHDKLEKAVNDYKAAKGEAEKLVNSLPSGTDKTRLLNDLKLLSGARDIPEVKDKDGNDIPDTVDAALKALKDAGIAKDDLTKVKIEHPEPYTAQDVKQVNEKITAFNTALTNAENAVESAKADKQEKDNLDTKLELLGKAEKLISIVDENHNGTADETDRQAVRDAITALTEKEKAWTDAVKAAGRGISAEDRTTLTTKATEFNKALEAANKALEKVNGLTDKADFEKKIEKFGNEKQAPTLNDGTNGQANEIPDSVDSANAKLADAQKAKEALKQEKDGKTEPYTVEEANAINAKVNEFNAALREAREAIGNAKDKIADDLLDSRLTLLGNEAEFVEAHDLDNDNKDDRVEIDAVRQAINVLKEKQAEWEQAIEKAGHGINHQDSENLKAKAEAFNTALKAANDKLDEVSTLSAGRDLAKEISTFGGEKAAPEPNDRISRSIRENTDNRGQSVPVLDKGGANEHPDIYDHIIEKIYNHRSLSDSANSHIRTINNARESGPDSPLLYDGDYARTTKLSEGQVTTLNGAIDDYNASLANIKAAIAEAIVSGLLNEQEKGMLNEELARLGDILPRAQAGFKDDNNNRVQDGVDLANLRKFVDEAELADSKFREIEKNKGNAVNKEEHDALKAQADAHNHNISEAIKIYDSFTDGEMKTEMLKHLNRLRNYPQPLTLTVPDINDTNNNDIPDAQEVRDKVTALESGEGRSLSDKTKGSFAVRISYSQYNPDYLSAEVYGNGTGKMFYALPSSGADPEYSGIGGKFHWGKINDGHAWVRAQNSDIPNHLKVAKHFGFDDATGAKNNGHTISFSTGNKDDALIVGGDAAGGRHKVQRVHDIDLGAGNDTFIVGAGNPDLHVGIIKEGDNLGRTVAKIGGDAYSGNIQEVNFDHSYYSSGHAGYLGGFTSINLGEGNNTLIVRQDVYRAAIKFGSGNDDIFIGGNFYGAEMDTGNGNDYLEFTQIGDQGRISTGAGNDILTVHKIENSNITVDLGADNDILVLKTKGAVSDIDTKNKEGHLQGLQGGSGIDTIVMDIDPAHAFSNKGLRSSDFQGFEKIVMKQAAFVQIKASDLFSKENSMELTDGKKVLLIENESSNQAKVNIGSNIAYETPTGITHSLLDEGGTHWTNTGSYRYDGKDYTVYSYSNGADNVEVWLRGNIEIL